MNYTLHLDITPEKLHASIPGGAYNQELPNIVTVLHDQKRVAALGETKEALRTRVGERWEELKDKLVFRTAFQPEGDPDLDHYVLFSLARKAFKEARKEANPDPAILRVLNLSRNTYDFHLRLPEYEQFDSARQERLRYFTQVELRARRLFINGQSVELPPTERRRELLSRLLLVVLVPYTLLIAGAYIAVRQAQANQVITAVAGLVLVGVLLQALGQAIWMLLMRRRLPASYLRYLLPRLPYQVIARRLAGWLLREK